MQHIKIIFFGSTTDSALVLEKLFSFSIGHLAFGITAVVTQPPRPIGRKHTVTPTPVALWAKEHNIPVLAFDHNPEKPWLFADESRVVDALQPFKSDLLISASFGQKIPGQITHRAPLGGLNIHPSLLPRWRGADPVPWAILSGDHQTGVTVVTLSDDFDSGTIIAQKKIPIMDHDTTDPLRAKLFALGADLLAETLPSYLSSRSVSRRSGDPDLIGIASSQAPRNDNAKYARRLVREDGFIPWEIFEKAMHGEDIPNTQRPKMLSFGIGHLALAIDRLHRAFFPWPGVWTEIVTRDTKNVIRKTKKRLKILALHASPVTFHVSLDLVQLEGKKPVSYQQFFDNARG